MHSQPFIWHLTHIVYQFTCVFYSMSFMCYIIINNCVSTITNIYSVYIVLGISNLSEAVCLLKRKMTKRKKMKKKTENQTSKLNFSASRPSGILWVLNSLRYVFKVLYTVLGLNDCYMCMNYIYNNDQIRIRVKINVLITRSLSFSTSVFTLPNHVISVHIFKWLKTTCICKINSVSLCHWFRRHFNPEDEGMKYIISFVDPYHGYWNEGDRAH